MSELDIIHNYINGDTFNSLRDKAQVNDAISSLRKNDLWARPIIITNWLVAGFIGFILGAVL
jgi:hypothetical protein